ncbi:unnamed protein product [Cuscuta epithymum]|uniref:Uncharacterized protein n=1 Tax=Cuscuta epithymum TaxID=186058 RepID=A0AAV0GCY5_9ASTE|nr:unnamed protein product [Cuscuta epithymum]
MWSAAASFWTVLVCFLIWLTHRSVEAAGSSVKLLPGFHGSLPFQLQTGYIGVGKNEEVQLFYYFIKSDSNPQDDPLILWISGGPGCSPLRAIVQQIGPMLIDPIEYNGSLPRLLPFPYSWTKVASFIFLDLPVGTGFSYATTSNGFQSDDLLTGTHGYEFLRKWLIDNPEFISNAFYVGGDSYSGITVPVLTETISNGIERGIKPLVRLQGYILGNPVTFHDNNYQIQFAHRMALISDELYESLKINCKGEYVDTDSTNVLCQRDLQTYDQLIEGIYLNHILEPICLSNSSSSSRVSSSRYIIKQFGERRYLLNDNYQKRLGNPDQLPGLKCRDDWNKLSEYWANDDRVQEALHVRKGTKKIWEHCTSNLSFIKTVDNVIPYHVKLSRKKYRSLVYSGDHDMLIPYISTQAWINSLNYSVIDNWRPWLVEGQVAGYTRTYANRMTFATVKGGGHTAPEFRPLECLAMFERWISYNDI